MLHFFYFYTHVHILPCSNKKLTYLLYLLLPFVERGSNKTSLKPSTSLRTVSFGSCVERFLLLKYAVQNFLNYLRTDWLTASSRLYPRHSSRHWHRAVCIVCSQSESFRMEKGHARGSTPSTTEDEEMEKATKRENRTREIENWNGKAARQCLLTDPKGEWKGAVGNCAAGNRFGTFTG